MNLELAQQMVKAGKNKAQEMGIDFVLSVVDRHGNLILLERMENALLASIEISQNKAYTAVALKMTTEKLSELARPNGDLYGINNVNGGRIITFGGGIPIVSNGEIIGGIGVSGASVAEDIIIAEACINSLK